MRAQSINRTIHFTVTILIAWVFGEVGIALSASAFEPAPQNAMGDASDALIQTLQTTRADADYDRRDFRDVIRDMRERFSLNIHVSWTQLEQAGIEPDQRVTVHLTNVPIATILDIALREVDVKGVGVQYFVENGVIIISTDRGGRPHTVLRMYDITDLIESGYAIRRFANTPVLSLHVTGREFVGGEKRRAGGGGGIFDNPEYTGNRLTEMDRLQAYIDLLVESIEPDSWLRMGGRIGSVRAVNGSLLIRHTPRTHDRIAAFFDMLRGTKPRPLDAQAMVVRLRADKANEWRTKAGDAFPRLDKKMLESLLSEASENDVLFHGTTTGRNGERLWFSALTQRDVLVGMKPAVAESTNAFATQSGFATEGVELIVLPLLTPDTEELTLDVQFAWIPPLNVDQRDVTLASGAEKGSVDQVTRSMRTVSSTVKLEMGEAVALTIPHQPEDGVAGERYEDWLIVRVSKPLDETDEE